MKQFIKDKLLNLVAHDKFTITLERFGRMIDSKENRFACKYTWMPKFIQQAAFERLSEQFSEMVSKNQIQKVITSKMLEVNLYNKVNSLLPSLYWCLYIRPEEKHLQFYYNYFGKECKGEKELQLILNEIKRLASKYKELFGVAKHEDNSAEFNFSFLVGGIEMVLDRVLDRRLKLYELEYFYSKALERSKKNEHGRD